MKLTTLAAVAVLTLASGAAQAQFTTNDLYLGFNSDAAQSDYIIDLGQAKSTVGVGGSTVVDLSTLISSSTFNSVFQTGANGVNVAVVGARNGGTPDVYATQVRVGGGSPGTPGSALTGLSVSGATLAAASVTLTGNPWPTAGNSTVDSTKSYTANVGPELVGGNFYSASGVDPFGTFDSSAVIYLDLWYAVPNKAYAYQGYFTVDLSGATAKLTFTPKDAPGSTPPPQPALSITRTGAVSYVSFLSANNASYNLCYTNSAGLGTAVSNWPSLSVTITGNGLTNTFQDTTTDPIRFYRVIAH
jgi:hypothetical protein